ncbi:MAG TPA: hypothetical protein VFO62_10485 [Candidatus Binatia bacterium]|nr:hypothetical protein [Candidatus Binatia bacterium]
MPSPSTPLATSLAVLAALLDGWATQPELAERVWPRPDDANRRAVGRHIDKIRGAGLPLEQRLRRYRVTKAAYEYRMTLGAFQAWAREAKGRGIAEL